MDNSTNCEGFNNNENTSDMNNQNANPCNDTNDENYSINQTLSLTSFLFGNIDAHGQLEGDVFDADCKRHLASLSRLGLGSILRQVTDDGEEDDEDDDDEEDDEEQLQNETVEKSPSAIDYFDINEVALDDTLSDDEDYDSVDPNEMDKQISDDESGRRSDSELMPPPPAPATELTQTELGSVELRKVSTPLAAMLPSKYANVDVRELFPDFRQDSVLRFSRLFGPGKHAHLPRIWKHVKRKKKRKEINDETSSTSFTFENDDHLEFKDSPSSHGFELSFGPAPSEDMCEKNEEFLLCRPLESDSTLNKLKSEDKHRGRKGPKEAPWRFGAAQLWYDMWDISPMGEGFDYGFKLSQKDNEDGVLYDESHSLSSDEWKPLPPKEDEFDSGFSDDAFHMITQYNWEDDIIWNGEDPKHKFNQKRKNMAAGWVPSSYNRTAQSFSQPGKTSITFPSNKNSKLKSHSSKSQNSGNNVDGDDTWYSIFPVENEELVYERWEDDIIWDPDNMASIPEPKILTLDPNDENIILGIPEDVDPATLTQDEAPVKVKIPHPHVKKSKILLGKSGVINTIEEESPPPPPKSPDKDPFNLSNDEYYQPKSTEQTMKMSMGGGLLQHSTPAVELQVPFVPTYMGEKKLRLFHRPPLKHFSHGMLSNPGPHPVWPLLKEIKRKAKLREQERVACGGGDIFFMRTPEDLTTKDGDIILLEYCEEYPPALSQVGMCTRIKNYYKRKVCNDTGPPEYSFGETSYAHTSPFLGSMHPGQSIQTFESNMCRVPLYEHRMPATDFLVIRTRNGYSIREIDALYCGGQECPLYEIPGPNSKRANNFIRDFLQVFIYRLFWKSTDVPKRIRMDDIKRAFPAHSESSIRKRLKPCGDFKRTGADSNWWVIKPEFRLPTEDEIRAMVSPEQCCAFYSMLSAEQRLKDAGYGDKFLSVLEDDNDDDTQKLDDEIKVAPWFTTRAYIHAVKGKCILQLAGPADPTGCGEGFSYIRIPNKPTQNKEEQEQQPKRTVTGTDADLRKLSLNSAKNLLRNYGVPEEEIQKLTRWEVIDVVRTLSTEKAKAGEEGMSKFSRGNRFSIAEHQERYKEECQRIFDLQNRVLASEEVLSTDEGSSEEEDNDSDMEEKGKYIENILANKKTSTQMSLEKEEQEKKDLLAKMIMGDDEKDAERRRNLKKDEDDGLQYGFGTSGRLLKITRTFCDVEGREYTRVETVRKSAVIDTYVKIRTTKDDVFIKNFAGQLDDAQKEEIKRERRRLQEQLRRIKRNQERLQKGITTPPKQKKPKLKPDLKLKCGACGQVGHMRTNKACPMYCSIPPMSTPALNTSFSEDADEPDKGSSFEESEQLINIDGTKIKLSSKVVRHAEELKRRSIMFSTKGFSSKETPRSKQRRRAGTVVHCDYLKKKRLSVNRRRIDPVITLSTIFEEILNEMRETPDVQPFLFPVNIKQVPDYYNVVTHAMDMSTIRDNLRQKKYQSREEFLSDINQIVENSKLYNGVNSTLTLTSQRMLDLCIDRFAEKEDKLMRLEKAINPLLDDDDQVAFDFILDNIVNTKLFSMQEAWPFMKPVNKKNVRDYYQIIEHPMDLQTVAKKVKMHKYHKRSEFIHDMELILTNSERYNGADSSFTMKAHTIVQFCRDALMEYDIHLTALEEKIALAQERALEQAEVDSLGATSDAGPDDEGNYTYAEPDSIDHGIRHQRDGNEQFNKAEHDTDYYGEDDDHINIDDGDEDLLHQNINFGGSIQGESQLERVIKTELSDDYKQKKGQKRKNTQEDSAFKKNSGVNILQDELLFNLGDNRDLGLSDRGTHSKIDLGAFSEETYHSYQVDSPSLQVDANYDPSEAFLGGLMQQSGDPQSMLIQMQQQNDEDSRRANTELLTAEQMNLLTQSDTGDLVHHQVSGIEELMMQQSGMTQEEAIQLLSQQDNVQVLANGSDINNDLAISDSDDEDSQRQLGTNAPQVHGQVEDDGSGMWF